MRTAPTAMGDALAGASARAVPVVPHIIAAARTIATARASRIAAAYSRRMRRTGIALLALGLLAGVVWMGQGAGLIGGSFMTGRIEWAVIGAIVSGASAIGMWLVLRPHRQ